MKGIFYRALSGLLIVGSSSIFAQVIDMELAKRYEAKAIEFAADDVQAALRNCSNLGTKSFTPDPSKTHEGLKKLINKGEPRPTKVFDNLYYLGTEWVGSWAITTDAGIILYDALNNTEEAQRYIEQGMLSLGLNPVDIKIIVVSQSHGDHYGGVNYLVEKTGAQVILSEADWVELEKPQLQFDDELWGRPPKKDRSVVNGEMIILGSTSIETFVTPGHTPGTLSMIVPVTDNGVPHKVFFWGGNGLNWGKISSRFVQMMDSAQRVAVRTVPEKIDVFLSNHASLDETYKKLDALEKRGLNDSHPFVMGEGRVERNMLAIKHCVGAQLATFDADNVPSLSKH